MTIRTVPRVAATSYQILLCRLDSGSYCLINVSSRSPDLSGTLEPTESTEIVIMSS